MTARPCPVCGGNGLRVFHTPSGPGYHVNCGRCAAREAQKNDDRRGLRADASDKTPATSDALCHESNTRGAGRQGRRRREI